MEQEQLRTRLEVYVHIVWATYCRQPLIRPDNERILHHMIQKQARLSGCAIIATGGLADHIHILLKMPSTISLSELTKRLKGGSSRSQSQGFSEINFRWQSGYSATSLHRDLIPRVKNYVLTQKDRHAAGLIWDELEVTGEK